MGVSAILRRERELVSDLSLRLTKIPGLHILAPDLKHRLCILSCTVDNVHYNLVVKLLSDRFGIQTRGGCACAGTYGHVLFDVSREASRTITERIDACDESLRPGFVRISLHPTTTNAEVRRIADALSEITKHGTQWARDYSYDKTTNEFSHKQEKKYGLHLQL
jgi:selenocysteine lyase/cysteine desulfurase